MILGALVIVVISAIAVNYFKSKTGSVITPNNEDSKTNQKIHTVAKGETLWSISEDYLGSGYNWKDIFDANKLESDKIEVGQKLIIPNIPSKDNEKTNSFISKENSQNPISETTYTVTKGDSLWKIAVRAYGDGFKWVEIARANKLANPNLIHPGNVLILPR